MRDALTAPQLAGLYRDLGIDVAAAQRFGFKNLAVSDTNVNPEVAGDTMQSNITFARVPAIVGIYAQLERNS